MICKLCKKDKQLVRAHVIPRSLYGPMQDGRHPIRIVSNKPGIYSKKSPIGIYDKHLLCEDCERLFSPWDDYAQRFLLQQPSPESYFHHNGERIGYRVENVDYEKLKLFFISVLWRASVSSRSFFSRINTGPFELELAKMIMNRDPRDPETFAVTVAKFEDPLGTAMLDPHHERKFGVNYYRFYMAAYVAYIKVDRRPAPDFMGLFKLKPGEPLIVILRNLRRSKDFKVIRDIARRLPPSTNTTAN